MQRAAKDELLQVLREARSLLARPENDFSWSSWEDATAALAEFDQLIATIQSGALPERVKLTVLFTATGPIQEVSLSSGWAWEFLHLAERFDAVATQAYGPP